MKDELGERMKSQYEDRTRYFIPRRTYTIIRLDGKAFHTYTRGLNKPFDKGLIEDMDSAVEKLMKEIQGAKFAYVQSDEISVLLTDFATPQTSMWFDGNIQKMTSVSSSIMTAEFNRNRLHRYFLPTREDEHDTVLRVGTDDIKKFAQKRIKEFPSAMFDARVFTIPDRTEVMNYFIWRNQDCARNSVSMVAQSLYSHKELHGKSTSEMQEMIFQKGINWAIYDQSLKNGRLIVKESYKETCELGGPMELRYMYVDRTRWVVKSAWKFTENKNDLIELIPSYD